MVVLGQNECIREKQLCSVKLIVLWQKLLYSEKTEGIWARIVVFGQNGCIRVKGCCIRATWLYSGKSCCIWAK